MSARQQNRAVAAFTCLGDRCEDTCCQGWGMQLAAENIRKFEMEAPELMQDVVSGEADFVMKRDPVTDQCVKFEGGWCRIHRDYGADFLGDACYFFPRITRRVGDTVLMGAALSCPESARLMLMEGDAFDWQPLPESRLPNALKQYLPEGMAEKDALELHGLCLAEAANHSYSAETNLLRLHTVMQALSNLPQAQWREAAAFYFRIAADRLPVAEPAAADPFNLLHALYGLVAASPPSSRPRLQQTMDDAAEMLGVRFVGQGVELAPDAAQRFLAMHHFWREAAARPLDVTLLRYLQAQVSIALLPFGGFGGNLAERMTIIGVRFATVKLALMAAAAKQRRPLEEGEVIRVVQSLSRFLDHLANPALSIAAYREAGWTREARLRGLLNA